MGAGGLLGTLAHFDPWGQPLGGEALPTGPSYTGEWSDATGLVNLRFRAYDPALQRFIGGDNFPGTASAPTTWNRFAYANANPLTYTDPTGHLGVAGNVALNIATFLPGPGDAYSMVTAIIGSDPIGGYELSGWERVAAAIPFVNDLKRLSPIARAIVSKVDDVGRAGARAIGEVGGAGRAAGGARRAGDFGPTLNRVDDVTAAAPGSRRVVRHGPMNPGPLNPKVAATFRSSTYDAVTLTEPTTLYRVYSNPDRRISGYWTREQPRGPLQSIVDSALDPAYGNAATDWVRIRVPAGTEIYEGVTAAQGRLPGGGNQIFLSDPDQSWIDGVGGF